jgi:hypothetical protein
VRAFTAYFHLANITEQVHRGRALTLMREQDGGWVEQAVERIAKSGARAEDVAEILRHVAVRPVFTAHPTEVARRSTIDKLRRVAALLEEPDTPRRTRRLEEAVELLWLTDEIRVEARLADASDRLLQPAALLVPEPGQGAAPVHLLGDVGQVEVRRERADQAGDRGEVEVGQLVEPVLLRVGAHVLDEGEQTLALGAGQRLTEDRRDAADVAT